MNVLEIIGRDSNLFDLDITFYSEKLYKEICGAKFLIIGGAGSIGSRVAKEIFNRDPKLLHVVDINENNLVELVRDLRSSKGYINGDFKTFALDCGSIEFEKFFNNEGPYDYVLNFSALKHVRNEKDPYTLMRMIEVNILNTIKLINLVHKAKTKKYFCISTDKATNPVNLMGGSKRLMEMFLIENINSINFSMARFANVAFSDGSLLHGFTKRLLKKQPISAPMDVKRYFLTEQEAGELCLMSIIFGENGDIFYPKLDPKMHLVSFADIAKKIIHSHGYIPFECSSEEEARVKCAQLIKQKEWPCYFFKSDTSGEKDIEEFYTREETLDTHKFSNIGVIKNKYFNFENKLNIFIKDIDLIKKEKNWKKDELVDIFNKILPNFNHIETGKNLDQKM